MLIFKPSRYTFPGNSGEVSHENDLLVGPALSEALGWALWGTRTPDLWGWNQVSDGAQCPQKVEHPFAKGMCEAHGGGSALLKTGLTVTEKGVAQWKLFLC